MIETRLIHTSSSDYYDDEAQAKEDLGELYDPADFEEWVRVRDVVETVEFYASNKGLFIDHLNGNVFRSADSDGHDFHGQRARVLLDKLK